MRILLLLLLILTITSCKSKQKSITYKHKTSYNVKQSKTERIIKNAKNYLGTKYKYSGTTKKGMDCSGLIYTSFKKESIQLPRRSIEIAKLGQVIPLRQIKKGDLLFFNTGNKNKINHVGLVTKTTNNKIYFIHASTKRGVIISSMDEKYYKTKFVKAKRILK
jgi:cell wall-associated NlpC family hydrolase